ncbi:hypothetical protein [Geobacillus thermodenitrificans]|uniref:hypothetical protein n=1 Tax=Geobacillus thermodenitrificans TaxID=33940 RepID=UPI002E225744|nr:hypothetical protein [Geobacillus thermodenitrificans]
MEKETASRPKWGTRVIGRGTVALWCGRAVNNKRGTGEHMKKARTSPISDKIGVRVIWEHGLRNAASDMIQNELAFRVLSLYIVMFLIFEMKG